ncbi:hypothetical protein P175DRAFT_0528284 [Aspergillus ochraceoroseus IBT 24754]|uniref:Dimethylallyl tryptophan synthase n=3 Tax=Aspergillus subgen. Nidulantes TaxID=2720870 RepID=A0A0F8U268_9EURO|nr:uncharacterized protein P175DRAFT_0528284 [Aspergillus ochraceoroseus IBT 24754]KKK12912.1 hypothetical protein AOCH_000470 [Aspergillus ochraceoroseus]KKK13829.1 hypothetical protein ARAM_001592 [Aspergillus rambellii]PTU24775.1 hypothetical protein P175DRAFT_0528284 [Aspergillus ochraceoroseus IBT 24754]
MTVTNVNDSQCVIAKSKVSSETAAQTPFDILTRYYVFPDEHQKNWWEKTGALLGKVLASANYSVSRQFEALTFYGQVLIPLLGPYPLSFRSAITRSGLPVEFSVNYQQRGEVDPVVRIGFEPVAMASGTPSDPYNQIPISTLLDRLKQLDLPGFDDDLFQHFLTMHTLSAAEREVMAQKKMEGSDLTSQAAFGFDLKPNTISVKGYTFPALKCHAQGSGFGTVISESIKPLENRIGHFDSFDMVNDYLEETNGYSQFAFWSFDCGDPAQSRLKLYSSHNDVVLSKIEEIWTLGGRSTSPTVQKGLEYLRELWELTKLSEGHRAFTGGFDDGKDSTPTPMVWNYEMKVGEPAPLTKFYFPIHGEKDKDVVQGLAQFLVKIGLSKYGEDYEQVVRDYFPKQSLDTTARLTSWISFAYSEKTGVYLSVYYHSSEDYLWSDGSTDE